MMIPETLLSCAQLPALARQTEESSHAGSERKILSWIYGGWYGKIIGIRHGSLIEGWTAEKIASVYGEISGYLFDFPNFAADDDSNGPIFFIRALEDAVCSEEITPAEMGDAFLNYAPCEHGFLWWGGYGNSTEHTAWLNLMNGIAAPRSGSMA